MSILVKGMEMPGNCDDCPFRHVALAFCHIIKTSTSHFPSGKPINQKKRHPKCPLVEVPGPHGRLIDADALIERMESDEEQMEEPLAKMFTYAAINDVKRSETVIEAEGTE